MQQAVYDALIARLERRALKPDTRVDIHDRPPVIFPKLSHSLLQASGQRFPFKIPELLRILYQTVGNGGFGPGYGLMGLLEGAGDDQGFDGIVLWSKYSEGDPHDPDWHWPDGLLPLCHWGCSIYSCVDCSREDYPIVVFDPNVRDETWHPCFLPTQRDLQSWLAAWADGVDLWKEVYGEIPDEN